MNKKINKYYEGYEGEPEIQFIKYTNSGDKTILSIWDGYFDDIMRQFEPANSGWEGLAYNYHLSIGWDEGKPWQIPDLNNSLTEFSNIDKNILEFEESKEVLSEICKLINTAIKHNEKVWIYKM